MKKLLWLIFMLTCSALGQNQYYVSSTGSDGNDGSQAHPWATINHAVSAFTQVGSGTVIHVLDGGYPAVMQIPRGGSSSSVRLVIQCDSGVADAWTAKGKCRVSGITSGSATIVYINGANNVDIVGFDIGNNANMSAAIVAASCGSAGNASSCSNSVHLIGNYIHDVGANVAGGCPDNGMLDLGNAHGVYISGLQVLRNVLLNFGHGSSNSLSCNTGQGMEIVGRGQILENNIIINVPVFGLIASCNSVVSNNVLIRTRGIGIGSAVSADNSMCPSGYGSNSLNNNYVSATDTIGGATFWNIVKNDQGINDCTVSTPNFFENNFSDGGVSDFSPATFPGCDTISPASLTHTAGSSFFVNYQTNGTGDYHLKGGSPGIGGGSSVCSSGAGAQPICVPATDFEHNPSSSPIDVGAFASGSAPPATTATLSPPSLNFGSVTLGVTGTSQTFTLTTSSSGSITISNVQTSSALFPITGNNCGAVRAASSSCQIQVACTPQSAGSISGTLTITDSASNSPQTSSLSCTGVSTPSAPTGLTVVVR